VKPLNEHPTAARHLTQSVPKQLGAEGHTYLARHPHYPRRVVAALRRLAAGRAVYDIAQEFGVPPGTIRRWRQRYELADE